MNTILIAAVAIGTAYGNFAYAGGVPLGLGKKSGQSYQQVPPKLVVTTAPIYRFELISPPQQNGGIGKIHSVDSESLIFVRLTRVSDGTLVKDGRVDLIRVDMAPDGMSDMTARSYIRPCGDPGTYCVEVHPTMAGLHAVTLAVRTTDRAEPVRQTLVVSLTK